MWYTADKLAAEGFQVTLYDPRNPSVPMDSVRDITCRFDLAIYLAAVDTRPNKTVSRINWYSARGAMDLPWFAREIPVLLVSLGSPFCLVDAPMIRTCVNGYSCSQWIMDAVIEKILGRSEFHGVTPVDPFCGFRDAGL